jgi:hypothetical protein
MLVARLGHGPMSDLSPLSGEERKLDFGAVRSVDDPRPDMPRAATRIDPSGRAVALPDRQVRAQADIFLDRAAS